ncbi:MAG: DivIVA domain-containing protein [Geodermatophilaceae bacterium]
MFFELVRISRDTIETVLAALGFVIGLVVISSVLFLVGSLVFGRGEELAPAPRDSTPVVLPGDRPPDASDVESLRLSVVFRGYRMVEVDWVLDQLAEALRAKDRQIAALTNQLTQQPATGPLVSADSAEPAQTAGIAGTAGPVSPPAIAGVADPAGTADPIQSHQATEAGLRDA